MKDSQKFLAKTFYPYCSTRRVVSKRHHVTTAKFDTKKWEASPAFSLPSPVPGLTAVWWCRALYCVDRATPIIIVFLKLKNKRGCDFPPLLHVCLVFFPDQQPQQWISDIVVWLRGRSCTRGVTRIGIFFQT